MDYKMKRAASAKVGKKFAAALSAAVLVAPTVASAVQPMVALAATEQKTIESFINTVTYTDGEVGLVAMEVEKGGKSYTVVYNLGGENPTAAGTAPSAGEVGYLYDNTWVEEDTALADLDGMTIDNIKAIAAYGKNSYDVVSFSAGKTTTGEANKATHGMYITSAKDEIANLGLGADLNFTVNTDIEVSKAAVAWYAHVDGVQDSTYKGTVAMTDKDGNAVTECYLSDLGKITVTPADGDSFRAWDLDVTDPTKAELTKADIVDLMDDEDDAAGRATVVAAGALKAVYETNEITVKFSAGEGTLVDAGDAEIDLADLTALPAVNNPTGKDFDSWQLADGTNLTKKLSDGGMTEVVKAINEAAGNEAKTIEVHAVYSVRENCVNNAELTFAADNQKVADFNGIPNSKGGKVSVATIKDAAGTTAPDGKIDVVPVTASAYKGYKFVGWYRAEGAEGKKLVKVTDKATLDEAIIKSASNHDNDNSAKLIDSTKFVAVFERDGMGEEYTLSFDLDGANKKDASLDFRAFEDQELTVGEGKATFPTAEEVARRYEKPGYTATGGGWFTKPGGKGDAVATAAAVDELGKSGDVTLYWNWIQDADIATFEVEGNGKISVVDKTGKEVADLSFDNLEKASATLTLPAQHKLNGWTVAKLDAKGKVDKESVKVVKALSAAGKLTDSAYLGTVLSNEVIYQNAKDLVEAGGNQTVVFTANVTPFTYTVTFGSEARTYTVGETGTPWPEGTWTFDGEVVTQADIEKMVTEDGQVFGLTEVVKEEVNKDALAATVLAASLIDPDDYTDETAAPFVTAYAASALVLADEDATQADVDAANLALAVAMAALQEKPAPLADGWHQEGTDSWKYAEGGEYVKGWKSVDGQWFYFDENGYMMDGWVKDGDNWYFMSQAHDGSFGAMCTGWVLSDGLWYYMNPNAGGPKGAMTTGWQQVNGKWYYLYEQTGAPKGSCAISTTTPDGYRVDASGAWIQ